MTVTESVEDLGPVAHVTLAYQGPTAPHWELKSHFGDQKEIDAFWARVYARLLLLPKHDPQFRRNRERVNRDAERERIVCDWDLGEGDAESTSTVVLTPEERAAEREAALAAEAAEAELAQAEEAQDVDVEGAEISSGTEEASESMDADVGQVDTNPVDIDTDGEGPVSGSDEEE